MPKLEECLASYDFAEPVTEWDGRPVTNTRFGEELGPAYLSAVAAGIVVCAWLNIFPFSELPDIAWAGVVVAVFTLSSVVHYHLQDEMRFGEGAPPTVRDSE